MSQHKDWNEYLFYEAKALLKLSAQQFRLYEKAHRVKNTPDSLEKAEVNNKIATVIETFLSENQPK